MLDNIWTFGLLDNVWTFKEVQQLRSGTILQNAILLESGELNYLLLESGDEILLER